MATGKGQLAKTLGQALGKESVMDALKGGGWKVAIDGNLGQTLLAQGTEGTLVGTDEHGNKYFENVDGQSNRSRWVVYADSTHFVNQNPTVVPPEWHGWLHYITDENPANADMKAPMYAAKASMHPTMTEKRYLPKGAWGTPRRRNWRKYEAWNPNA